MSELLQKLEKSLKRTPLQKFYGLDEINIPIEDFIYNIFHYYNKEFNCVRGKNKKKILMTRNRLRSVHDIYALCRAYYKKPSFEEILKIIFSLCKKQELHGKWKCNNIRKYVFSDSSTPYDSSTIREDIISNSLPIKIVEIYTELGFKKEDFKKIK